MSMTDLERELRETLIEAGKTMPVVEDLATRAARPVRRRRAWLASGVAAVTMAAVGVAVAVTGPGGNQTAGVPAPSPSATPQTLTQALIGTWRPIDIVGFDRSKLTLATSTRAAVTFDTNGKWGGTDGCNGISGTYQAGDDGSITADTSGPQTLIGCANVPNKGVLHEATKFPIAGRTLTFLTADGDRLGTYERPTGKPIITACPRDVVPEPSGTGPDGAFVPPNPTDVLVCRYEHPGWKLTASRVIPRAEAVRLAAELNRAEGPEPGFKCPAPVFWEAWVFQERTSQVVVKAGWCNLVVGQGRAVKTPPGWLR